MELYKESFINDYSINEYNEYLDDINKLKELYSKYIEQYTDNSEIDSLAFKESLDHYVLKKLKTDPSFIDSKQFNNYYTYSMNIAGKKKFTFNNTEYHNELITNVVFRDDNIREKIFNKFANSSQKIAFYKYMSQGLHLIDKIKYKLINHEVVSISDLKIIADYIYSSRNLNNGYAEAFIKYIMNDLKDDSIKAHPTITGALGTIFVNSYGLDEDVKNTRFFIGENHLDKPFFIAHSSPIQKIIAFQKTFFDNMSLTSSESLNKSRTNNSVDIYWLMMVTFHELTHQHQKNEMDRGKLTSSGLSYAINKALSYKTAVQVENYKRRFMNDYLANHDTDEIEMQADEEGWRQTRKFIATYKLNREDKWVKAFHNELRIQARRAFSTKKTVEQVKYETEHPEESRKTAGLYYAIYDLVNLEKQIKNYPELLNKYPLLKNLFNSQNELDTLGIATMDLSSNEESDSLSRNDVNNSGLEVLNYVFATKWKKLSENIANKNLNDFEIERIRSNFYHVAHENVLKVRNYLKISKELNDYDETKIRFDLNDEEMIKEMMIYYFTNLVNITVKYYGFKNHIKDKYNKVLYDEDMYYLSYIYELFDKIEDKNDKRIVNAISYMDKSSSFVLRDTAYDLRKIINTNRSR